MIRRKDKEPPPSRKPGPIPTGWKFSDWAMI
jgi:hypothetical protein